MSKTDNDEEILKIPADIPEDFFDIVKKVLSFIEHVDEEKQNR